MGEAVEDQQASGQTTHDETHVQMDPEVEFMNVPYSFVEVFGHTAILRVFRLEVSVYNYNVYITNKNKFQVGSEIH